MSNIQALSVDIKEVGKKIKSSKKRFTWFFSINGKKHTVDLFVSKLSGKKKLILNGKSIHEEKNLMAGFCQRFELDGNSINVQTKGDSFEMVFNKTQSFSELYTQAKTRSEFQEEEGHFDSYDNDFSKGKPMQSKYQGFSSSTYHPPQKNTQEMKNFSNSNKNARDNNNFNNNNNPRYSDDSNSGDEPSSGKAEKQQKQNNIRLRINKGNQNKVDSKKPSSNDPYGFDSGFDKYDWKGNGSSSQAQKPKPTDQAFDNFNNQFANPQRSQQQQAPSVVQPKQKVPPTTDFSQFTFGGQQNNNKQTSQQQSQQPSQISSQQAKNAFEGFGAPNANQPANGGQKSADPFQDFFKQGNENIFVNSGSQYNNNKPASNPSNSFNNFGQPTQDNLPQQQKVPSQQQIVQQPPPPQPVKQQVNVFDLLGDDEPQVPVQPVQQQLQPQVVQQPVFQAQQAQQQASAVNNNLVNLVNNLSINPSQSQPSSQIQPSQPQQTDLLNMYQQQQSNQVPQQQQKPQGPNYAALYAVSNPFEAPQQQPVLQQYNGNQYVPQQGYGQQQQQYNPYAQQQQFQQPPQQQYLQQGQQFQQVQQQQPYQQQQFQPQQPQQIGGYPSQNTYGYNNNNNNNTNIGVQGAVPNQFQPQVVQQGGQSATPFDDLF